MRSRQKLPQELLMQRLKHLSPNAVINVRPYDNNESLVSNPVIRGDYLIDWDSSQGECPSLEAINAVLDSDVEQAEEIARKVNRNAELRKDLRMKAVYRNEKRANPSLSFSDYLDQLEAEEV